MELDDEDKALRAAALQNVQSILQARQRAERELLRTKEALEEETRILELLNATGAALASKLDLDSVVQTVTDAATKLSGAEVGAFVSELGQGREIVVSGAPLELCARIAELRALPLFEATFRGDGIVRLDDVHSDPRGAQADLPIASYLAVPVVARSGDVVGGLFFGHRAPAVFTERAERLIAGIAAQAATAIDNARLYEEAQRSAEERARLLAAERAARAEIERVSLMKDQFLATLSHELRTPLNAILGWAELLLSRVEGDAHTERGLETIARNARAQSQLIEDLLDMSAIVSGKIRIDVQGFDVAAIVDAAMEAVKPSANAKAITLLPAIERNTGPLFGDPNRVQQVIWNLLTNAVKFTPRGGTVEVKVVSTGAHVDVVVRDSGMGIAADLLPHVFERFRQADSSSTRRYGGLGLGLSIVKQLVELHGGSVRAESAGEGAGSTFVVSLPLPPARDRVTVRKDARPGEATNPLANSAALSGVVVLVVDDEADARDLVEAVLTGAGADVVTASNADEAMAALAARRPDVIVSDIGMPDRDGLQLVRDVRALAETAGGATPAIALTAFARSEDKAHATRAGYQFHVAKPIEPHVLVETVQAALATRAR